MIQKVLTKRGKKRDAEKMWRPENAIHRPRSTCN